MSSVIYTLGNTLPGYQMQFLANDLFLKVLSWFWCPSLKFLVYKWVRCVWN